MGESVSGMVILTTERRSVLVIFSIVNFQMQYIEGDKKVFFRVSVKAKHLRKQRKYLSGADASDSDGNQLFSSFPPALRDKPS